MARNMLIQLIASFVLLALLSPLASAESLSIYQDSDMYKYQGCFNETVDLADTAKVRALADGASKTYPVDGNMTVPICLSFCNSGTDTQYKYAGVEYSRECWCSQRLSSLATKLDDTACNTPCDGNRDVACGGALKLSVYMMQSGSARVAATAWALVLAGVMAVISL